MQTRFTLWCIQSGEKCSFISLLAPYPFNKYKFLIKILSSSVKVILFIYITVVCQGAWLPWKPCSWYSTRTKLFKLSLSATEWRCLVWKIIMGELILMNLCRPALGVRFFETQCTAICVENTQSNTHGGASVETETKITTVMSMTACL